uniref:Uncharacterized protein n=1 Tax=Rhizophora mucronata TaxID=61149 RepID=A0A2P2N1F8_RHIMU
MKTMMTAVLPLIAQKWQTKVPLLKV